MPVNIEIKARIANLADIRTRVAELSDAPVVVIPQEDIFFRTESGRLKLRVLSDEMGQLIYYERPDLDGPKRSDYHLAETRQPNALKKVLTLALGVRGVVKKTRYLYLTGQTRIHLDQVEGLGSFLELEVVLRDGQEEAQGQAIAGDLMRKLEIPKEALLEGAYMDMIEEKSSS